MKRKRKKLENCGDFIVRVGNTNEGRSCGLILFEENLLLLQ